MRPATTYIRPPITADQRRRARPARDAGPLAPRPHQQSADSGDGPQAARMTPPWAFDRMRNSHHCFSDWGNEALPAGQGDAATPPVLEIVIAPGGGVLPARRLAAPGRGARPVGEHELHLPSPVERPCRGLPILWRAMTGPLRSALALHRLIGNIRRMGKVSRYISFVAVTAALLVPMGTGAAAKGTRR